MSGKKRLSNVLGITSIIASFILAGKLIFDFDINAFWTTPWVVGILGIIALSGIGIWLLAKSEENNNTRTIFGVIYAIVAIIIYVYWATFQIHSVSGIEVGGYMGFALIFSVALGMVISSWKGIGNTSRLVITGLAGIANLGLTISMIYRYVFKEDAILMWTFTGELFVILLGAVLFVKAYKELD